MESRLTEVGSSGVQTSMSVKGTKSRRELAVSFRYTASCHIFNDRDPRIDSYHPQLCAHRMHIPDTTEYEKQENADGSTPHLKR